MPTSPGAIEMKTLLASLLVAALHLAAQPAQVILFRHAEKPVDEADVHLSPRGQERARALISLLGPHSPYTANAPVAALYATRVSGPKHSRRTGDTLAPLSEELGLPINTRFASDEYALLARSALAEPAYRGKTVIICWTHNNIGALAEALGVKNRLRPWKDKVFDRFWLITLDHSGGTLRDLPQRLLVGDSER